MSNYKERIDAVTAQLKNMESKVFLKSQGENGEYYKGLLDGTLEEFSAPKAGVTTLAPYRFYNFSNLKKADFTGVTEIPDDICQNCSSLQELVIDTNTTEIGLHSFDFKPSNAEFTKRIDLIFNLNNEVYLNDYSFYRTGATTTNIYYLFQSLKGKFNYIGSEAFEAGGSIGPALQSLEEIDILINGRILGYAFGHNYHISKFNLDKNSDITSISIGSFGNGFGYLRLSPENNIFVFDLRNSTFLNIPTYCFSGITSNAKSSYFDIYLPSTCITIATYCFQYSDYYNIYYKNVPTLSNVNSFSNATNFKNFFPYDLVHTAKTATNWSSTTNGIVGSIYGWAEENTFTQGQTLPTTDSQGWALTWYSDIDLTQEVTTVDDPTKIYYCIVGERTAVVLTQLSQYQATCTVTDSAGNTYTQGNTIPVGTVITITAVGEGENTQPYIFTLNGNTIASGDTYTIGAVDVSIVCIYWDGVNVPVNPTFSENTPAQIKAAVDNGLHRTFWTIGDEKQIELTDGRTVTLRYIDQKVNRYEKTDGSGYTNAVFEINPLIASKRMNASNTNAGGWPATEMSTVTMAELYALLPSDWQSIFSEAKIPSATSGTDGTIVTANNKSFIASGQEIFAASYLNNSYYDEGCTQFDWYSQHNTNADRIKQYQGSNQWWWLRSPRYGSSYNFCGVNSYGNLTNSIANSSGGVCLCLPI